MASFCKLLQGYLVSAKRTGMAETLGCKDDVSMRSPDSDSVSLWVPEPESSGDCTPSPRCPKSHPFSPPYRQRPHHFPTFLTMAVPV